MTNLDRWLPWYDDAEYQQAYDGGDDVTYRMAADWLDGLAVEDWGAGYAWFKRLHRGAYLAVDGSRSEWCDVHADLVTYRSSTPGLLLRHVLEHNPDWAAVLDNAVASFTERMCVVLFTPLRDRTHVIATDVGGLGVPDISFALADLTGRLVGCEYTVEHLTTDTFYGVETVLRVSR